MNIECSRRSMEEGDKNEHLAREILDGTELKKGFWGRKEITENPEVVERLKDLGIEHVNLNDAKEKWQFKVTEAVEDMYEEYPEIQGYLGRITVKDLPEGVYACVGPVMDKEGFHAELQLSREKFSKDNLEWKLVDMEVKNFRGEGWFAGTGLAGVLKHEMAHVMHLRMIAEEEGLKPGEIDKGKFKQIQEKYEHNAIAVDLCYGTIKELGISPRDIGKELSTYGSKNFGEFFAEAISEYETAKHPRKVATMVHDKYVAYVNGFGNFEKGE